MTAAITPIRSPPMRQRDRADQQTPIAPTIDCTTLTASGTSSGMRPSRSAGLKATIGARNSGYIGARPKRWMSAVGLRAARSAGPARSRGRRRGWRRARGIRVRRASADGPASRSARTPRAARSRAARLRGAGGGRARGSRRYCRPSALNAEICSETRPTRKTTAANIRNRTAPFGILLCVATVQPA